MSKTKTMSKTQGDDPEFVSCKKKLDFGKKKRCPVSECNKRLKITDFDFKCKCKEYHCRLHRAPPSHNCDFDYNAEQISMLRAKIGADSKVNPNVWSYGSQGNTMAD